ncbi:MAG: hypothetical protein R3D53_05240 [Paracoccaceae bacterium]|jgi:hypothetical protein
MKNRLLHLTANQRLKAATHWTVFSLGLLSLTVSIAATAVNALTL